MEEVVMKIWRKARGAKASPVQPSFARVFVRFCSMTSSIAAAHGAGILILKAQQHHPSTADQRQPHGKREKVMLRANF
jgi:hypothetical protein